MKIYHCNGLTGGAARNLDGISVADLVNGARAIVFTDENEAIFFEFQATATDAEQAAFHPYKIRPDDYSSQGVWYEQEVWDMDTPGINLLVNSGLGYWSNGVVADYSDSNTGFSKLHPTACCTDPDDDQDNTTGWTASNATLTSEGGGVTGNRLKVAATAANGSAYRPGRSMTEGKLYPLKVKAGADVGDEYKIQIYSPTYGGYAYSLGATAGAGAGNWDTIDVFILCPSTQTDWQVKLIAANNGDNAYFDNVSFSEGTPACVAANTVGPDGWKKTSTLKAYRWQDDATHCKGEYGVKIVNGVDASELFTCYWSAVQAKSHWYNRYRGRTVTFGCWVYDASGGNGNVKIKIVDSDGNTGSAFVTSNVLTWVEITRTIASDTTTFYVDFNITGDTGDVCYISRPRLKFGNSIGEGNYIQPPGEIIWCNSKTTLADYSNVTLSADADINLEEQSNGKLPKGCSAIHVLLVGKCANPEKILRICDSNSYTNELRMYSQAANVRNSAYGWVFCDSNGNVHIDRDDTFNNVTVYITGVQIR